MTPAVFNILLVLIEGERHGYAIMREIERRTRGELRMGPGTLYGCIQRMIADGVVEESDGAEPSGEGDERRRYYRVTSRGRRAAAREAKRMSDLVAVAARLRLLPEGR